EEPVDPPLLHQALNEIEIGFAVLHLERTRLVAGAIPLHRIFFDIEPLFNRIRIVVQDRVENLDHALVLEDLVVARQRREPQPRSQYHAIDVVAPFAAEESGLDDETADFAHARTDAAKHAGADSVELNADGHFRADHRLEIEVSARGQRHLV